MVSFVSTREGRSGTLLLFPVDPGSEEEETPSHPWLVPLNFNFITLFLLLSFPLCVNDEGVEFRSTGGTWQFECPLARLGGQPGMFK
jgi:hypothetical protein